MIPKQHRLKGSQIPHLITTGRRSPGHYATIIYSLHSDSHTPTHISVIVPVRLSKHAVTRNRTKRLLREAIKPFIDTISPHSDMIIMANMLVDAVRFQQLHHDIEKSLTHANLLSTHDS